MFRETEICDMSELGKGSEEVSGYEIELIK